ncbi:hypothetical protein OH773_06690 [Buttiauxella sp. WJP83]|uniref:hypothetical protein n=1 Tax=Buttiauxella sp. WJP83 TaxID=2986951 RepID=UPI0022DE357C|nr:hypothetical protein [Buttiauxella sp. WJP83]WBM71922.1 hypothetical protein OH773_06690 [Buttiauxella sp. WJP83]
MPTMTLSKAEQLVALYSKLAGYRSQVSSLASSGLTGEEITEAREVLDAVITHTKSEINAVKTGSFQNS